MTDVPRVAVIGEQVAVAGYVHAGALVLPAADADTARSRWTSLGEDVAVVLLTQSAAAALGDAVEADGAPMTVLIPEVT